MHKFFHIIILYIALASPAFLWAQESFTNRYNTIYITMNEGLPNNFVDDIYKGSLAGRRTIPIRRL